MKKHEMLVPTFIIFILVLSTFPVYSAVDTTNCSNLSPVTQQLSLIDCLEKLPGAINDSTICDNARYDIGFKYYCYGHVLLRQTDMEKYIQTNRIIRLREGNDLTIYVYDEATETPRNPDTLVKKYVPFVEDISGGISHILFKGYYLHPNDFPDPLSPVNFTEQMKSVKPTVTVNGQPAPSPPTTEQLMEKYYAIQTERELPYLFFPALMIIGAIAIIFFLRQYIWIAYGIIALLFLGLLVGLGTHSIYYGSMTAFILGIIVCLVILYLQKLNDEAEARARIALARAEEAEERRRRRSFEEGYMQEKGRIKARKEKDEDE